MTTHPASPSRGLRQVFYVSQARIAGIQQVNRLLRVCVDNNSRKGISGLLIYTGNHFAQVIEGPEPAIGEVMERIAQDPRHTRMRRLAVKPVTTRSFGGWAMKMVMAPEIDDQLYRLVIAQEPSLAQTARLFELIRNFAEPQRDAPAGGQALAA